MSMLVRIEIYELTHIHNELKGHLGFQEKVSDIFKRKPTKDILMTSNTDRNHHQHKEHGKHNKLGNHKACQDHRPSLEDNSKLIGLSRATIIGMNA